MKKIFLIMASCFLMTSSNASLEEIFGNAGDGDYCASDYQCESLCCNKRVESCGAHNPGGAEPVFCNKSAGESCIASEFCKTAFVSVCKIYKAGQNPDGSVACSLRCAATETRGTCVNGACWMPSQPPITAFDPNDCSGAI